MPPVVVGVFVVVHGLITTMIGTGALSNRPALGLPSWFNWWPGPFGRSWLIDALNLGAPAAAAGALIWLASGLLLIAAGIGYTGVGPLPDAWPLLAVAGGGLGLLAIALYFHPLYVAALAINLALVVLASSRIATSPLPS